MSVEVAESITSRLLLSDGVEMPMFGLGMSRSSSGEGGEAEQAVKTALKYGYIMIDTAQRYGNESDVGRAILESGVERSKIFVVSKLWGSYHGHKQARKGLVKSLERLQLDYVDLFLIHSPYGGKIVQTYQSLLEAKEAGLIRSVGVSNFDIPHLEGLKSAGLPAPSVNQFELHVWQRKKELVDYCRANNIAVMGYSPLAKAVCLDDPHVLQIAKKCNKTYGQILIRWSVQNGFITIPKTAREDRIMENAQVFGWQLEQEDMDLLNTFLEYKVAWDPTTVPWTG